MGETDLEPSGALAPGEHSRLAVQHEFGMTVVMANDFNLTEANGAEARLQRLEKRLLRCEPGGKGRAGSPLVSA